jgi:hypothetical protein
MSDLSSKHVESLKLYITAVPPGEAPLWVREKWLGLSLPLAQRNAAPISYLASGVLSGPKTFIALIGALLAGKLTRQRGFRVPSLQAVEILERSCPQAAAWWRQNAPRQLEAHRHFLFQEGTGHVIRDNGGT